MYIQNVSPSVCCFLSGNGCLGHLWSVVLTCLDHLTVLGVLISIPRGINLDKSFISAQSLKHNQTSHRAIVYLVVSLEELGFGKQRMGYI